jgi:hypothetical protein
MKYIVNERQYRLLTEEEIRSMVEVGGKVYL